MVDASSSNGIPDVPSERYPGSAISATRLTVLPGPAPNTQSVGASKCDAMSGNTETLLFSPRSRRLRSVNCRSGS